MLLATVVIGAVACADREPRESLVGQQAADRLCPIQAECDCEEDLLIPECEATVTREIGRTEQRAIENGLVLDEACLGEFLARLTELGSCGPATPAEGPSLTCAVYSGTAEEGEPCEFYDLFPVMVNCRPGLECKQDICSTQDGFAPPPAGVPVGEECGFGNACAEGGHCQRDYDDIDSIGLCVENTAVGQPCSLPHECSFLCEEGTCQPLPTRLCLVLEHWQLVRDNL